MNTYEIGTKSGIYRAFGNNAEEAVERFKSESDAEITFVYPMRD